MRLAAFGALLGLFVGTGGSARAAEPPLGQAPAPATGEAQVIDLPTALRLAGAENLEVKIAREQLAEAEAADSAATMQFLPWLSPAASLRAHDNRIQDVVGNMLDADKHSYTVGLAATLQLDVGDAIYRKQAAQQGVQAASAAVAAQEGDAVLAAATGYFELVRARAFADTVREAVRISSEYEEQIRRAVDIGIANRGDELRVRVQTQRYAIELRRALEQQRVAASRLAQVLHLDPALELRPQDEAPVPLTLVPADGTQPQLVERALQSRPELQRGRALIAAAERLLSGAEKGPLIPSLSAQAFVGGLGGGRKGVPNTFGDTEDYAILLGWRIGPGGLLDSSRTRLAAARLERARLEDARLRDEIVRQVVESFARVQSTVDQTTAAQQNLETASQSLRLSESRKEFGVASVLEVIQAQRDLTQARADYLNAVAENDKAQYALRRAIGPSTP
jgi:outer membrane protein TolC